MVNFGKFSSENTVIFDDFLPKMTKVRSKYVSWDSNQEWGSIEADTVSFPFSAFLESFKGKNWVAQIQNFSRFFRG